MYSYFLNGEVNAVLGIDDSSNGIWWYLAHRSNVEKCFAPFNWENILYFWHGPDKFLCDLNEFSTQWLEIFLHHLWGQL